MSTAGMNVTEWSTDQRRTSSYVVLGTALAVVLCGLALWYFVAATPAWVYWALVGALALVLAFMCVLLFVQPKGAAMASADSALEAPASEAGSGEMVTPPVAAFEPRVLTLRCGDCGTIFEVTDTGERPLYHTCPGCGAEGALRDPVEAPPAEAAPPVQEPAPAPPSMYAQPPAYSAPPALLADPAPAAPVKKLKLRCGGCKEVFSIEDTGERPLKRACPHCGRIGKIG